MKILGFKSNMFFHQYLTRNVHINKTYLNYIDNQQILLETV